MEFYEGIRSSNKKKWLKFGGDLNHDPAFSEICTPWVTRLVVLAEIFKVKYCQSHYNVVVKLICFTIKKWEHDDDADYDDCVSVDYHVQYIQHFLLLLMSQRSCDPEIYTVNTPQKITVMK